MRKYNKVEELQDFLCGAFCDTEAGLHSYIGHHKWKDHATRRLRFKIFVNSYFWASWYFIKGDDND